MQLTGKIALSGVGAVICSALWWRAHPSACPYGQRFWVQAPHPFITQAKLLSVLEPRPGERILEVGPGTGYYTLPVANALAPTGSLDIFDVQPKMLEHTAARAHAHGLTNVTATAGDAQRLPFLDASFDAAYLTAVLGEIPDQDAALRELRRVVKQRGRLIVGELFGDPHFVSVRSLERRAHAAGLRLDQRAGPPFAYFARFSPA